MDTIVNLKWLLVNPTVINIDECCDHGSAKHRRLAAPAADAVYRQIGPATLELEETRAEDDGDVEQVARIRKISVREVFEQLAKLQLIRKLMKQHKQLTKLRLLRMKLHKLQKMVRRDYHKTNRVARKHYLEVVPANDSIAMAGRKRIAQRVQQSSGVCPNTGCMKFKLKPRKQASLAFKGISAGPVLQISSKVQCCQTYQNIRLSRQRHALQRLYNILAKIRTKSGLTTCLQKASAMMTWQSWLGQFCVAEENIDDRVAADALLPRRP